MGRPPPKDTNDTKGLIPLGPIPAQAPVAAFNHHQIESLLQTKGFECYHYKHASNPDRAEVHGPVNPNSQAAHRGYIYYEVRKLRVVPQSFRLEDRLAVQGVWGMGTALFNVTGEYIDGKGNDPAYIRNDDLIVLNPTITMMTDQLFQYNPTGPQKLLYRAKGVDYLADTENRYVEDRDFRVHDGMIFWIKGGLRPKKDAVLTIVYYITPIYIVKNIPHHLRLLPSNDVGHGALPREVKYAPQQVVAQISTLVEEKDLMNWFDLPPLPEYPDSGNVTGGSL